MERAQGEEQDVNEQPATSIVQEEYPETPGKDDMVLDVHVTIEEYPRPEKEIADHTGPESAQEAPPPSLDEQSVEEFIQAHRQEEEEEEEEREVVRPEEEEAEQELEAEAEAETEAVVQEVASPAPVEVKDEVPLTLDTGNQAPEPEKPSEGITNEEEPQPVRRA
jgi:hypothetical protein